MFGFGKPSELELIPGLMLPGEEMESWVKAVSEDNVFGVLVLTNKRLMFVGKGLSGSKTEDFSFDQISSIDVVTLFPGAGHCKVTVQARGGFSQFKNVPKGEAEAIGQRVRQLIYAAKNNVTEPAAPPMDRYVLLEKIADLKSKGILSDDEFQAEKIKILNG